MSNGWPAPISRERFIDHFAISIDLDCLRMWGKREKEPPTFLSRLIYRSICKCNGDVVTPEQSFCDAADMGIIALYGRTPRGTRPDRRQFAEAIYDALTEAGIGVGIRPPLKAHGGAYGRLP